MRRLSSYPKTLVTFNHYTRDGNGNLVTGTTESRNVVWTNEVRHVMINGNDYLVQSWYVDETEPSNKDMKVVYKNKIYTVAGYLEFNDFGLKHYQVFLQ